MIKEIKCKKILSKLPQKTPPCVSPQAPIPCVFPSSLVSSLIPPAGL